MPLVWARKNLCLARPGSSWCRQEPVRSQALATLLLETAAPSFFPCSYSRLSGEVGQRRRFGDWARRTTKFSELGGASVEPRDFPVLIPEAFPISRSMLCSTQCTGSQEETTCCGGSLWRPAPAPVKKAWLWRSAGFVRAGIHSSNRIQCPVFFACRGLKCHSRRRDGPRLRPIQQAGRRSGAHRSFRTSLPCPTPHTGGAASGLMTETVPRASGPRSARPRGLCRQGATAGADRPWIRRQPSGNRGPSHPGHRCAGLPPAPGPSRSARGWACESWRARWGRSRL
jgi:hypothetical protein